MSFGILWRRKVEASERKQFLAEVEERRKRMVDYEQRWKILSERALTTGRLEDFDKAGAEFVIYLRLKREWLDCQINFSKGADDGAKGMVELRRDAAHQEDAGAAGASHSARAEDERQEAEAQVDG